MGGVVCQIIVRSIVRTQSVPTNPAQHPEFEAQLRKCYANPEIARSVADEPDGRWKNVCAALSKPSPLSVTDLGTLWSALEEYMEY